MATPKKLIFALALFLPVIPAGADTLVFVVNGSPSGAGQFGTLDVSTGAFTQAGPDLPEGSQGLVAGPGGSLLSLGFSGKLDSINPATGAVTVIGNTGLTDCAAPPASPCGPKSANSLAAVNGQVYITDFTNNLYKVDLATGKATLVGPTGVPKLPFTPTLVNPDNTFNAFDEGLFGANGKLYATFDALTVSLATFTPATVVDDPFLYEIDPATGATTKIGPTDLGLGAVTNVNGTFYAFNDALSEVETLDITTGHTSFVSDFDPAAGIVTGAAATPEPASLALAALGTALLAAALFRQRATPESEREA